MSVLCYNDREILRRGDGEMTTIIGMHYSSGKGALVLSDSRTMRGGDYSQDRKLFQIDNVAFAAAGYVGMVKKLVPRVETTRIRSRLFLPSEIVDVFEDEMAALFERYKVTRPFRFSPDDNLLTGIIGFLEADQPRLYCLHDRGYAEEIEGFLALGHGARHAHNILRVLHDPEFTRERALEVGIHTLVEVAKADAMVDDYPQIAIIEDGVSESGLLIMNEETEGDEKQFHYVCPEIEDIKEKLQGIEDMRTKAFHVLLSGPPKVRKKLEGFLREVGKDDVG